MFAKIVGAFREVCNWLGKHVPVESRLFIVLAIASAALSFVWDSRSVNLMAIAGGCIAYAVLLQHLRSANAMEEANIQKIFSDAIEHLGSNSISTMLGGAYSLLDLAMENDRYRDKVRNILISHICSMTQIDGYQEKHCRRPSDKVQKLLSIIFDDDRYCSLFIDATLDGFYLRGADFSGATLKAVRFVNSDLQMAEFIGANLQDAVFASSQLQGAKFRNARMQNIYMMDVKMHCANLFDAQMQNATLIGVQMQLAEIGGTVLHGARMFNICLDGAIIGGAMDMRGAIIGKPNMGGIFSVQGARWMHSINLHGAIISGPNKDIDELQEMSFAERMMMRAKKQTDDFIPGGSITVWGWISKGAIEKIRDAIRGIVRFDDYKEFSSRLSVYLKVNNIDYTYGIESALQHPNCPERTKRKIKLFKDMSFGKYSRKDAKEMIAEYRKAVGG